MIEVNDIEELKNYYTTKAESGTILPSYKSVSDGTIYFLKGTDGVYIEHIMFNGEWHKKVVDGSSQVILEKVN